MSTDSVTSRYWLRLVAPRPIAGLVVIVFGSASAALASLLAEDLLPVGGADGFSTDGSHVLRVIAFATAVVITGWGAWSLRIRRRQRGTLYYLRLQNETSDDIHAGAVRKAQERYMGFRSISAWCDPGTGTVDVRRQVSEISGELQRAVNDDADDSGYDIAPNLILPAALAVGYDWVAPRDVKLREFNPGRNDVQQFEWRLACAHASGRGCEDWANPFHRRHFVVAEIRGYRVTASTTRRLPGERARSVWLEFRLTRTDWSKPRMEMSSVLKDRADVQRVIAVRSPCASTDDHVMLLDYRRSKRGSSDSRLTVLQIAEAAAYWLRRTLEEYPGATIFVAGAVPKTVGFAMGFLMTRPPMRRGAAHPWRRIVPMGHFMAEQDPQLRPMWVRADQRSPDELIEELTCR